MAPTKEAIHRAIRAECPGGNESLDLLRLISEMLRSQHGSLDWASGDEPLQVVYRCVLDIVNAMEDGVRGR